MRLRKPYLAHQLLPTNTSAAGELTELSKLVTIDSGLQSSGLSGLAVLPNGFGNMYVGTTFQAYVCLNNESPEQEVTAVSLSAEIRTKSKNTYTITPIVTRVGTTVTEDVDSVTLPPGEALHQILQHSTSPPSPLICLEVLERGEYTLEVGVTYTSITTIRTFRKMYNFTTFDTIAVRSMTLPHKSRSVVFQMHIENTGDARIQLTRVFFHCEPAWATRECNGTDLDVFCGRGVGPREVVQTMFVLVPKTDGEGEMGYSLGRVEIDWVGGMGERGSIITGMMKRKIVSQDT
jgi:Protein of unknown function (DUF974)